MWREHKVAVIVPAYNEERWIDQTLKAIPQYVDAIYLVDDASCDGTEEAVRRSTDPRVVYLRHQRNQGVGAAIVTGYRAALATSSPAFAALAVMAGDNQMHPEDLEALLEAVLIHGADYAKGNRFTHPQSFRMPRLRRWGSRWLSSLTRVTTGLAVDDTQCGYTVLKSSMARALPLDDVWPRYGYPNDLLALLAARKAVVREVSVAPVYADQASGLHAGHLISISFRIVKRWYRLKRSRNAAAFGHRLPQSF